MTKFDVDKYIKEIEGLNPDVLGNPKTPEQQKAEQLKKFIDDNLSLEDRIAALAQLSPIEYDQQRKTVAKKMGVQLKTLDLEVAKARGADGLTEGSQADIAITLFNHSGARLFHGSSPC
jgi:hypothetical protein